MKQLQGRILHDWEEQLCHTYLFRLSKLDSRWKKYNFFKYSFKEKKKRFVFIIEKRTHIVIVHQFWRLAKKTLSQQFSCSYCCGCQFRTALRKEHKALFHLKEKYHPRISPGTMGRGRPNLWNSSLAASAPNGEGTNNFCPNMLTINI